MAPFENGCFVTHAKLPDLGSGEILSQDKGTIRISFSSGERSFSAEKVAPHLAVTQEAPARPAAASRRARKKKA